MVKISLPEEPNFYADLMRHPNVLRVVALSGGYTRQEADAKLTTNHDLIASFSRALTEGLTVSMTDKEFDDALDKSIASIYAASLT
jgi:fructose-bisphosphate aldolase, class I